MFFEKVSKEQFKTDFQNNFIYFENILCDELSQKSFDSLVSYLYDKIKLPQRATTGSAGYDFYFPIDLKIKPNENVIIPTGIKCKIQSVKNIFLALSPRSGHGFKYRLRLNNTVGIIDSDYYNNKDNEGHIFINLSNEGSREVLIKNQTGFCQGIFLEYFLTENDKSSNERIGGLGSTTEIKNKNFSNKIKKDFEVFWATYPLQNQPKEQVLEIYTEVIKNSSFIDALYILNKAKEYKKLCEKEKREEKYIKKPTNFLNQLIK